MLNELIQKEKELKKYIKQANKLIKTIKLLKYTFAGANPGGPGARPPPRPPKMRPQHQNSTKLRPQNGSFRP